LRDQSRLQEALIVTAGGDVIASVGGTLGSLVPELPSAAMLHQARMTRGYSAIESGGDVYDSDGPGGSAVPRHDPSELRLRVVVLIPKASDSLALQSETRFLQLLQPVPTQLAANAEALRLAYSEYQERSVARTGLRKIYLVTL